MSPSPTPSAPESLIYGVDIGGIYEVSSDEGQDKVPGLSKVPLLKHLFRNNRQSEENEELLIFITPRVVNL